MSTIRLTVNQIPYLPYGHMQMVYDPDGVWKNGDELELEVQPHGIFPVTWDVSSAQPYSTGSGTVAEYVLSEPGRDPGDIWQVLLAARDALAAQTIAYRLGVLSGAEGQNSNSYITTLAHIAGIGISDAVDDLLARSSAPNQLPGVARNVLFDHVDNNNSPLPPVAISISGSAGADVLQGGDGNDGLAGLQGDDILRGFGGNDALRGNGGADRLSGGRGKDSLQGDAGSDWLRGEAGDDRLQGGKQSDHLAGGGGNDRLAGQKGDDFLFGGRGDDRLLGDRGADRLDGGPGDDQMSGGPGADLFVFRGTVDEGNDVIRDFADGVDRIQVAGLSFADVSVAGGADAVITLGGLTQITLDGVAPSLIDAADFVFV